MTTDEYQVALLSLIANPRRGCVDDLLQTFARLVDRKLTGSLSRHPIDGHLDLLSDCNIASAYFGTVAVLLHVLKHGMKSV